MVVGWKWQALFRLYDVASMVILPCCERQGLENGMNSSATSSKVRDLGTRSVLTMAMRFRKTNPKRSRDAPESVVQVFAG